MDIHIRPLMRHPLSLPARAETRSTPEILGNLPMARYSEVGALMLDHPPVLLVHDEGGEELLNRDVVMAQLGLDNKKAPKSVQTPSALVAWVITSSSLKGITTPVLHFLFGQIQLLHYRKFDGSGNLLTHIAVDELIDDETMARTISHEFFGTSIMRPRHFSVLFASANLGERSIGTLSQKHRQSPKEKNDSSKEKSSDDNKPKDHFNEKSGENLETEKQNETTKEEEIQNEPVNPREEQSHDTLSQGVEKFYRYAQRAKEQLNLNMEKSQ